MKMSSPPSCSAESASQERSASPSPTSTAEPMTVPWARQLGDRIVDAVLATGAQRHAGALVEQAGDDGACRCRGFRR